MQFHHIRHTTTMTHYWIHTSKNFRFTWLISNAIFLDDIWVMPGYFTELTHCIGLSHRYISATLHWYLGLKAIQCDFLSLNCKHNSLAVITLISSNFWSPEMEDDNTIRSSACMIHDTQHRFIWQPLLFINTLLMNISINIK